MTASTLGWLPGVTLVQAADEIPSGIPCPATRTAVRSALLVFNLIAINRFQLRATR